MTAPTYLPDTARALAAYDYALAAFRTAAPAESPWRDLNAAAQAVYEAWESEDGDPGDTIEPTIRSAVDAYEATLCAHCATNEADDGYELCRECTEIQRQDQLEFERSHSAQALG